MHAIASTGAAPQTPRQMAAMKGAYWALLAFFVVYCVRPEDWIHPLAVIPLAKITGVLAVLAFLMSVGSARTRFPRELLYFLLLVVQLFMTVPFSPVWRGGAFWNTVGFAKLLLILPVMILAAANLHRLRQLIFIQGGSVATLAVVSIIQNRRGQGRLEAASNSVGNPNDFAMALCLALPFCLAFLLRTKSIWRKALWALGILAMSYAVFLTQSRAGLLALIISMGACVWEFAIRGGRRYLLLPAIGAAIVLAAVAGKGLRARWAGTFGGDLSNPEARVAYGSAMERREMLRLSIEDTLKHPIFGLGTGNFTASSKHWRETHNNFTQYSCEGGIPALILFLMILWRAFSNVREAKRLAPMGSEEALWASALNASLLGFVVGSMFASVAYLFFPYFLIIYTSILRGVVASNQAPPPEPVAAKQVPKPQRSLFELGRASSFSGSSS